MALAGHDIERLVQSLQCARTDGERAAAVRALCPMAILPSTQPAILAAGGAAALVQSINSSRSEDVQLPSLAVLGCLANSQAGISAIVAAGGVDSCWRRLSSRSQAVQSAAVNCLAAVAAGSPQLCQPADAAGYHVLVQLLQSGSPDVQHAAAGTVTNLAQHGPHAAAVMAAGAAPFLAQSLHSSTAVQGQAAAALAMLGKSVDEPGRAAIAATGCVPDLVRLLGSPVEGTRMSALLTISHLAVAAKAELAHSIPALVDSLNSHDEMFRAGALALSRLARNSPDLQRAAATAGAIPILAHRLKTGSFLVKAAATAALDSLAESPENCQAIAAAGGIPAVVPLASSSDSAQAAGMAHVHVAGLLSHLAAASRTNSKAIAAAGGAPVLQQLMNSAPEDGPHNAAAVLQSLVAHGQLCAATGCSNTQGLRRSGGCGTVRYCSEACSKAHWRAHRQECRRLQAAAVAAAGDASAAKP